MFLVLMILVSGPGDKNLSPVGEGGQSGGRRELGSLSLHLGRLPFLSLGELGGDNNEAQVYHEKGPDLQINMLVFSGE